MANNSTIDWTSFQKEMESLRKTFGPQPVSGSSPDSACTVFAASNNKMIFKPRFRPLHEASKIYTGSFYSYSFFITIVATGRPSLWPAAYPGWGR
jgi:hypothetical protein